MLPNLDVNVTYFIFNLTFLSVARANFNLTSISLTYLT